MLFDQLLANQGKSIVLELVNGRKISGTLMSVTENSVKMEAEEGIGTIPLEAIQVIWEGKEKTITEENMEYLANQLRSDERISCTARPGFNCANRYICEPPDNCAGSFACPGVYSPAYPQGGCNTYNFYNPCPYYFSQPCHYGIYQPCGFNIYQPCGYHFNQGPCAYRFGQPCYYRFNQPCRPYQFQQPCTYHFGSQCGTVGGFTCAGQSFYGLVSEPKGKKE